MIAAKNTQTCRITTANLISQLSLAATGSYFKHKLDIHCFYMFAVTLQMNSGGLLTAVYIYTLCNVATNIWGYETFFLQMKLSF